MSVLAVYSNKGGVGKTATAVNLAYLSATSGEKTLIIDLDPQGSASFYFRVKPKLKSKSKGLTKASKVEKSVQATDFEGLEILPADLSHRNLDLTFSDAKKSKQRLNKVLKPLGKSYDLIVLDCPPTLTVLAENVFGVADVVLVPLVPTTLSVRSYKQLVAFMDEQGYDEAKLRPFLTMVDARKKLHKETVAALRAELPSLLENIVPYRSQVEQMGLKRQPLPAYAPRSGAAKAYGRLWQEVAGLLELLKQPCGLKFYKS